MKIIWVRTHEESVDTINRAMLNYVIRIMWVIFAVYQTMFNTEQFFTWQPVLMAEIEECLYTAVSQLASDAFFPNTCWRTGLTTRSSLMFQFFSLQMKPVWSFRLSLQVPSENVFLTLKCGQEQTVKHHPSPYFLNSFFNLRPTFFGRFSLLSTSKCLLE